MTEKLAAPKKPKQTKAELEAALTDARAQRHQFKAEIDSKCRQIGETEGLLLKAEKAREQLHRLVQFLRNDRAALVQSIRVLSEEHDLDKGRAVLQPTWSPAAPWPSASYAMAEPGRKS